MAEQYRVLSLLHEQYCSAVALAKDIDYWAVDPNDLIQISLYHSVQLATSVLLPKVT